MHEYMKRLNAIPSGCGVWHCNLWCLVLQSLPWQCQKFFRVGLEINHISFVLAPGCTFMYFLYFLAHNSHRSPSDKALNKSREIYDARAAIFHWKKRVFHSAQGCVGCWIRISIWKLPPLDILLTQRVISLLRSIIDSLIFYDFFTERKFIAGNTNISKYQSNVCFLLTPTTCFLRSF